MRTTRNKLINLINIIESQNKILNENNNIILYSKGDCKKYIVHNNKPIAFKTNNEIFNYLNEIIKI